MYSDTGRVTLDGMHAGAGERWRLGHRPGLDGLRGIAIVLVVWVHTVAFLAPAGLPTWARLPGGGFGVELFFVLSGFLITTLLLEERARSGRISIRGFYGRRARRLFPAAFATLVAWSVAWLLGGGSARALARSVVVVLTYSTDYFKNEHRDVIVGLGHFWSLAVEEQFYFVAPVILLVLLRRRVPLGWIAGGAAATAAVVVAWRSVLLASHPVGDVAFRADARCDGLLLGVALAAAWKAGMVRTARLGPAALVGFLALAVLTPPAVIDGQAGSLVSAFAVVLAGVMVASVLAPGRLADWMSASWLRYIGRISYSLYLWHVPVIVFVWSRLAASAGARMVVAVVASFAVAALSRRFVEEPFLRRPRRVPSADLVHHELGRVVPPGRDVQGAAAGLVGEEFDVVRGSKVVVGVDREGGRVASADRRDSG